MPVDIWTYPRSIGPAGSTLYTSLEDFLSFVTFHLHGQEGVLSDSSWRYMQSPQFEPWIDVAGYFGNTNVGLPWRLAEWEGRKVLAHSGGSPGGGTYCLMSPDDDLAIVTHGNSARANYVAFELMKLVVTDILGISPPVRMAIPDEPLELDLRPFVGDFERLGRRISFSLREDEVDAEIENLPIPNFPRSRQSRQTISVRPVGDRALAAGRSEAAQLFRFIEDPASKVHRWMETGRRMSRRRSLSE